MIIKIYSTVQHSEWCHPGALVGVDEDGYVVWTQINPLNDLTREYIYEDKKMLNVAHFKSLVFIDECEE
jgi:hypothetical protein